MYLTRSFLILVVVLGTLDIWSVDGTKLPRTTRPAKTTSTTKRPDELDVGEEKKFYYRPRPTQPQLPTVRPSLPPPPPSLYPVPSTNRPFHPPHSTLRPPQAQLPPVSASFPPQPPQLYPVPSTNRPSYSTLRPPQAQLPPVSASFPPQPPQLYPVPSTNRPSYSTLRPPPVTASLPPPPPPLYPVPGQLPPHNPPQHNRPEGGGSYTPTTTPSYFPHPPTPTYQPTYRPTFSPTHGPSSYLPSTARPLPQQTVLDQYDRRNPDGSYEFRYELPDETVRYERGDLIWYQHRRILAVKGYYSYRLPDRRYHTVYYTADQYGYRTDSGTFSTVRPKLPHSLKVDVTPQHELRDSVDDSTSTPSDTTLAAE